MRKNNTNHNIKEAFVPDEINALIRYASERGLDRGGQILINLSRALESFTSGKSSVTLGVAPKDKIELPPREAVLSQYSELAALTQPVNGRTLVDTEKAFWNIKWIMLWTAVFFVLAVSNKILFLWFEDMPEPEDGKLLLLISIQRYVLDYLSAFFWGGLGSCVYLLKTLSDRASERSFDLRQLQGWGTRIMLGAILGAVVQYIYDPEKFAAGALGLDASAVAFFTGVGVKVVYGAIEKTIDTLASKMNLEAIRRGRAPALTTEPTPTAVTGRALRGKPSRVAAGRSTNINTK